MFLYSVESKQNLFLSSEPRNIGKTVILNELAFNLQALGYIVLVLTPYRQQEYFGEHFISLDYNDYCNKINGRKNVVIIADEARKVIMEDFLVFCEHRDIPVIGYVNFRVYKPVEPIEFEREYESIWIKQ